MLQASLKVIGGKNDGKQIEFKTSKFLVGREQDCHLRPNSDLVSRHHCVFTLDDYALRLRDLGSTNGTLVNGQRIRGETILTPGDVVRIGKLNLEVMIGSPVPKESALPIPHLETTTNASALDTAFDMPEQTALEDSGMISASPSSDTVHIGIPVAPSDGLGTDGEIPLESDTSVSGNAHDQTLTDQPVQPQQPVGEQPQQPPQHYPPDAMPPNAWQYPPQYPQYPQYQQYQQYPPPGYPMAYPPGFPPGYGYPPQQYPPNYQQPDQQPQSPAKKDPKSEGGFPDIRLPNPEDTGLKETPKPAAEAEGSSETPKESTPSESAANFLASRRRRRPEEK